MARRFEPDPPISLKSVSGWLLAWAACAVSAAVLIGVHLPIEQNGILVLAAVSVPWLWVLLLPAWVWAFFGDRWILRAALSLALLLSVGETLVMALPKPGVLRAQGNNAAIMVMSFSLWHNGPAFNLSEYARVIRAAKPDVLLLQEIDAREAEVLRKKLEPVGLVYSVSDNGTQLAVISRYPLTQTAVISDWTRMLQTEVAVPDGALTVWDAHFWRPGFARAGLGALAYDNEPEPQAGSAQQTSQLLRRIRAADGRLIVGGDFNIPALSPDHRSLNGVLEEAHMSAGIGLGFTFPATDSHKRTLTLLGIPLSLSAPIRLARIDHIFFSRHFIAADAEVLAGAGGSDHAPITAWLTWAR